MTVLSELSKIAYIGSSSQTLYPIPFEYINTDDIKVSIYTSNNEFVEDWTYSIQYVIEGGNVKVLSGYNIDNTKKLLILRSVDLVQDNKYREGGDFPAKSTETSFDKLTMITQQLQETLDRCVKVEVLDIQSPEELLQTVYDKLDSATEIAGDAISAANQAQTAADNATAAVNSAEQTLVQTQAYVDSAKVEINNTKNTAINTINSTVSTAKGDITNTANNATSNITSTVAQAKTDINAAIDEATMDISNIVSDAEGSITNIAVTEANKAIENAAQEATDIAVAKLQPYVNQAQEDANSAAASMEQAALSATAASNYASNASADADNAAESAGLAANSASEAAIHNFKNKITNCITEIPQDIKLELNNGTLTLKAGSKVYVPNGAGVFDVVTISRDLSTTRSTNIQEMYFVSNNGTVFNQWNNIYSGTSAPSGQTYMVWYDTANNIVKVTADGGSTWTGGFSLPVCLATSNNTQITSIDQVFNGFGYIGSTVFALPGIKGLIPNGRNTDGSLKNTEVTVSNVILGSRNLTDVNIPIWLRDNKTLAFSNGIYYDEKSNLIANTTAKYCQIGVVDMSTGRITSFTPKTAFHAVDYQDFAPVKDSIPTKQDIATAVNYDNITNCITEIPQDIKLELNNGTLTLKAGSKVYYPNGFESDGTTPKFDAIVIPSDYVYNADFGINHSSLLSFGLDGAGVGLITSSWYSGTTAPTSDQFMLWYDTNTNKIKWTSDYGTTWTEYTICLPITRITIGDTYNVITSIDQVFNGFGYIGSTVFALPGIKGLIPNGRNADGSLKNIAFETSNVLTFTYTINNRSNIEMLIGSNSITIDMYYKYDEDKNLNFNSSDNIHNKCAVAVYNNTGGKVNSFTPKTAFHAVDWNDVDNLMNNKFKVVSALPASPETGTFYFIPE